MADKKELLNHPIEHYDLTAHDPRPMVRAMGSMAFTARDLHRASEIYDRMIADGDCGIILCLAGSLISAGLKRLFVQMIENRMVDAIVSTGANIVDQDFFEALGYRHYLADEKYRSGMFDGELREMQIDRIYDTFIDEDDLRHCDETIGQLANTLEPRPYSSRQFIAEMGQYLQKQNKKVESIVQSAYEYDVPIFCPAFSDCSAGFGLVAHQHERLSSGQPMLSIDSARDFYELTQLKILNPVTGLLMIGGGVPKNFAQDIVVAADVLGHDAPMHKYAIQITVADVRDGALSGSTLKEASSWGKVDLAQEQMVYSEATLALPLIAGYAYHQGSWKSRQAKRWAKLLDSPASPPSPPPSPVVR